MNHSHKCANPFFAALVLGLSTLAAPSPSPASVVGSDDRIAIRNHVWPFAAVVRFETGKGTCAATLITPKIAITASHCVPPTLEFIQFRSTLADVRNRATKNPDLKPFLVLMEEATPKLIVRDRFGKPISIEVETIVVRNSRSSDSESKTTQLKSVARDIALLVLDIDDNTQSLLNTDAPEFRPVGIRDHLPQVEVAQVGAPSKVKNPKFMSLQTHCTLHEAYGPFLFTDCDTTGGNSGGALLQRQGNSWALVGVISAGSLGILDSGWAFGYVKGAPAGVAVSSQGIIEELKRLQAE